MARMLHGNLELGAVLASGLLAILAGTGVGLFCGIVNGAIVTVVRVPSLVEVQQPARCRCYCNSCRYGEAIDPDGKWPWVCDNPEREYRCPSCGSIRLVAVSLEIQQQASLGYEGLMSLMGKRPEGVACEPRMEDL